MRDDAPEESPPTAASPTLPAAPTPVADSKSVATSAPVAPPAPVVVPTPAATPTPAAPATAAAPALAMKPAVSPAPAVSAKPVASAVPPAVASAVPPAVTSAASPAVAPAVVADAPTILLLRATSADADPLSEQLKAFGFDVRLRTDLPDLPAPWPFVAVFVDLALRPADGGDAIDLCNEVRERSRLPGVLKPVLVLVADQLSPTNRVRAGLAGCNEILLGAISRGSVAKVLDTRGIKLPSDQRKR
ncbi:MAG TPA: hypothetical protein VML58_08660 [Burkholderiaceae bacterium]|nr:hypothetical protein [Burkholderiaceae bacterium]